MPTFVGILKFIIRINYQFIWASTVSSLNLMLSIVEHEKSFIAWVPGCDLEQDPVEQKKYCHCPNITDTLLNGMLTTIKTNHFGEKNVQTVHVLV